MAASPPSHSAGSRLHSYSDQMIHDPRHGLERLRRLASRGGLDDLCQRHGVLLMSVFGSAVSPEGHPRDLDIAVAFAPAADHDLLGMTDELVQLAGVEVVDVMELTRAGPLARERALVGSVALYESEQGAFARAQMAAAAHRMETDWLRRLDLELIAR
jgi:predicted nucleotidyltransferase